jgi:hypothetical protein
MEVNYERMKVMEKIALIKQNLSSPASLSSPGLLKRKGRRIRKDNK